MIVIVVGTLIVVNVCSMKIPIGVANIITIVGKFCGSMRRPSCLNVNKATVIGIVSQQYNTFSKASKLDKVTIVSGIGQGLKYSNCWFSRCEILQTT